MDPATRRRVVVVGGGLAGMAAATALESAGIPVTLLEARRSLGGRAGSFEDPQTGEELDNCQHVLLGCCTNLMDFYRRLGVQDRIVFERELCFVDGRGRRFGLRATPGLPAPLHLGPSMARFGALSFRERVAATRAMLAMMRMGREERDALGGTRFGDWLAAHRQPASLIDTFYESILTGALNERCRDASAAYAIQVFQDALLAHSGGYVMGLPNCPLSRLYERLPCRDARLGVRVAGLIFDGPRVAGVELQGGQAIPADAVVLATGYQSLERWVPADLASSDPRFGGLKHLESVPILGAHLWFDVPVLRSPHAALLRGPLQWVFRKDPEGRAIHGVISAAREWVDRPREEMLGLFERQIREVFAAAAGARLLRGLVVVEKRATYSPVPGVDRLRPAQGPPAGGLKNLYLAGDYTLTGWPATMEGAVRSGYLAAEAVCRDLKAGPRVGGFIVPDLPAQWPARVLGMADQVRRAGGPAST